MNDNRDDDNGLQQIKLSNRDKSVGVDDHRGKLGSLSKVPNDDVHSDGMPRVSQSSMSQRPAKESTTGSGGNTTVSKNDKKSFKKLNSSIPTGYVRLGDDNSSLSNN